MNRLTNKANNQDGSALLMVLILVSLLSIMGSSLIYVTFAHHENVIKDDLRMKAYYAAETGIKNAIKQIERDPARTITLPQPTTNLLNEGNIEVSYQLIQDGDLKNGSKISLSSKGFAVSGANEATTTISVKLDKNKPLAFQDIPFFDYSIFAEKDLTLGTQKVNFVNWRTDWRFLSGDKALARLYDNEEAILKNKIVSIGDVYSNDDIYNYSYDKAYNRRFGFLADMFFSTMTMEDFWTSFDPFNIGSLIYYKWVADEKELLGIKPTLIDAKQVVKNDYVYNSGYYLFEEKLSFKDLFGDGYKQYSTNGEIDGFSKINDNVEYVYEGSLDNIMNDLVAQFGLKSFITYNGDLRISNDEMSKNILKGWIHVTGNLIIDAGVEIDNISELIVLVDKGILIGANISDINAAGDPVVLKGDNIVLAANGSIGRNELNTISSIRDYTTQKPVFFGILGKTIEYEQQSYMNVYAHDVSDTYFWDLLGLFASPKPEASIVVNNKSEIDGWLVGRNDVVFDYKLPNDTTQDFNSIKPVKIGGVVGEKILFPESIEIAKDLYIYDWDVQYN